MSVWGCGCRPQHTGQGMSESMLVKTYNLQCLHWSVISVLASAPYMFSDKAATYFVMNAVMRNLFLHNFSILQSDMQRGVHGRLMDNSTSVREAAVELLGRFVLSRPQLTEQYYDMLIERILVRFQLTSSLVRLCHKHSLMHVPRGNSPVCWWKGGWVLQVTFVDEFSAHHIIIITLG